MVKVGAETAIGKPLAGHEVFPAMVCPRALTSATKEFTPWLAMKVESCSRLRSWSSSNGAAGWPRQGGPGGLQVHAEPCDRCSYRIVQHVDLLSNSNDDEGRVVPVANRRTWSPVLQDG